jgi:lysophospholipid acyltransferase (LPLAT)-like uncharacterized protein
MLPFPFRRFALRLAILWIRSLRTRFVPTSPSLPPSGILVLWHSDMLPCLRAFVGQNMRVLISQSRDGEFGAHAAAALGYRVVRGSSSRGGATALRGLTEDLRRHGGWIALVADGPRGPHRVCKPGASWLSQATGLPVVGASSHVPIGFTLGGWAQVKVPVPFSIVEMRLSAPHYPEMPEDIDRVMREIRN